MRPQARYLELVPMACIGGILLWVIVAVVLMVVFQAFGPRTGIGGPEAKLTYSQFVKDVQADRIKSVEFTEDSTLAVNVLAFVRKDNTNGTADAGDGVRRL